MYLKIICRATFRPGQGLARRAPSSATAPPIRTIDLHCLDARGVQGLARLGPDFAAENIVCAVGHQLDGLWSRTIPAPRTWMGLRSSGRRRGSVPAAPSRHPPRNPELRGAAKCCPPRRCPWSRRRPARPAPAAGPAGFDPSVSRLARAAGRERRSRRASAAALEVVGDRRAEEGLPPELLAAVLPDKPTASAGTRGNADHVHLGPVVGLAPVLQRLELLRCRAAHPGDAEERAMLGRHQGHHVVQERAEALHRAGDLHQVVVVDSGDHHRVDFAEDLAVGQRRQACKLALGEDLDPSGWCSACRGRLPTGRSAHPPRDRSC